jgi:hypothetical protein
MRLGGSILDADFTSGVGPFYAPITNFRETWVMTTQFLSPNPSLTPAKDRLLRVDQNKGTKTKGTRKGDQRCTTQYGSKSSRVPSRVRFVLPLCFAPMYIIR